MKDFIKKHWYVALSAMLAVSIGKLGSQSVKYNYDAAGNRISRSVVANSPVHTPVCTPDDVKNASRDTESPLSGDLGGYSLREVDLPQPVDLTMDSSRFEKKYIDGELFYVYKPDRIDQLSEEINESVQAEFFLPEPIAEEDVIPFSVAPASFSTVPLSVEPDKTKAVGEIPISSGVSNGAITYTIPIEIYPGRHNFQPNLSLTYNSMAGYGIAGYGWNIGGLSAIMPVHSNYYYDGTSAEAEKLGTNAAYALDGIRLIRRSAGVYETEQGFIDATVQDQANKYYFNVTYPDGRKAVYGYTNNTTPQISYPLTRVTDLAGNFIDYTYKSYGDRYLITEISYGANDNTIGKIKFKYKSEVTFNKFYIAGKSVVFHDLLSEMEVYFGTNLLRTYTLEHTKKDLSFLSKVYCKAGTKELNPVSFYYGTGNNTSSMSETSSTLINYFPSVNKQVLHKFKHNNLVVQDGLISYPQLSTYGVTGSDSKGNSTYGSRYDPVQTLLVYSNMSGSYIAPTSLIAGKGFQGLYPADIDGDGRDELIRLNYFYNSGTTSRLEITTYNQNMTGTLRAYELPGNFKESSYISPVPRTFLTGNFTGDGRTTLVAVSGNKTPKKESAGSTYVTLIDLESKTILSSKTTFSFDYFNDFVFTLDFDGDGRTDLCVANSTGSDIYSYINGTFTKIAQLPYSSGYLMKTGRQMLLGDINGDGKTDILLSPPKDPYTKEWRMDHLRPCEGCCGDSRNLTWNYGDQFLYECSGGKACYVREYEAKIYDWDAYEWHLLTSTGNSVRGSYLTLPFSNENNNKFLLQDVNGDHLPDLIVKEGGQMRIYLNNNGTISATPAASRSVDESAMFIPAITQESWSESGDLNRMNQLLAIKDNVVASISFSRNDGLERKLSGVVNSLGVINKIRYAPMNDRLVYNAFVNSSYPYSTIFMNELLVKDLEVYHNYKQIEHSEFQYENGTFHRQGLGFCGFRKIITTDWIRSMSVETEYDPTLFGAITSVESPARNSIFLYRKTVDSKKFSKLLMIQKNESDKLNNTTVSSLYNHDTYGNVISEEITYGNTETVTIASLYNNYPRIGELYDQTITTIREGNQFKERTYISSFHATTRQPLKVYNYVNDGQVMDVTNTFANGNLTQVTQKPYTSTKTLTTKFEYDNYGRIIKETDPLNLASTLSYNAKGELVSNKNHKNKEIKYEYDDYNRLIKTTYPDGAIETTEISWMASTPANALYRVEESATGQSVIQVYYDAFNREIRKGMMSINNQYRFMDYQYDKGRLSKVSLPFRGVAFAWTNYSYDNYDRPLKVESPSGNIQTWAYSPGKIITTENGVRTTQTFDAAGKLISVTDTAGTISYGIRADAQLSYIIAPGNVRTDFTYDSYGRRIRVTDPSFGDTYYTYNAEGSLLTETDANNKTTRYTYDDTYFVRMKTKALPEFTVTYNYNSDGLISGMSTNKGTSTTFTYDNNLLRLTKVRENAPDNKYLEKELGYTGSILTSVKYTSQSGVIGTENFTYTNGKLTERKLNNQTSFFKLTADNDLGMPTTTVTGGITRTYGYNSHGTLESRSAKNSSTTFQNFSYVIDPVKGNMTLRKDNKYTKTENFEYDNLNRLEKYGTNTVTFDVKGNILTKSDAGTLSYTQSGKPYAVSGATNTTNGIPQRSQSVTYTSFKRPDVLSENNYTATFTYNGSFDRVKMHLAKGTARELTRYYLGGCYEIDETGTSNVKEKLYLGGDYYTAPAVYVRENSGTWQLYYICRDHLGSITHITNSSGSTVTQEMSYDAWGRLRNPSTQANYTPGSEPALFLGRGYTGHEYLPQFGLVNMNARLYDPVLGRFLAPDPYIQNPGLSQNYNRYTYGMNNPLVFIDKDGEIVWFIPVIAAVVGGAINLAVNWKNIDGFAQGLTTFIVGAGAGAATALTAGAGASFWAVSGVAAAGGFIQGANNSLVAQTGHNFIGINHVDWGHVGQSAAASGVSSFVGGLAAQYGGNAIGKIVVSGTDIMSPAINDAIREAIGESIGGYAGGLATGLIMTGSLKEAHSMGLQGLASGLATGFASGLAKGYQTATDKNINPWTGKGKSGTTSNAHVVTTGNKQFTNDMAKIAGEFGLDIYDDWNLVSIPSEFARGRRPHAYHQWVLDKMQVIQNTPGMNQQRFIQEFNTQIKQTVIDTPNMLRKTFWKNNPTP